jgi:hypothetical protein
MLFGFQLCILVQEGPANWYKLLWQRESPGDQKRMVNTLSYCPTGFHTVLFTHPPTFSGRFSWKWCISCSISHIMALRAKEQKKFNEAQHLAAHYIRVCITALYWLLGFFHRKRLFNFTIVMATKKNLQKCVAKQLLLDVAEQYHWRDSVARRISLWGS